MGDILDMTFQEQEKLAEQYDETELEYQDVLNSALVAFFLKIGRNFTNVYSATGEIIDAEEYKGELEVILTESYIGTSEYFSRHFDRELIKQTDSSDDSLAERSAYLLLILNAVRSTINLEISDYVYKRVPKQAGHIIETTNNVLDKSVAKAKEIIDLSDDLEMDDATISKEAGKIANKSNTERVTTISQTETGNAVNSSKHIEAREFEKEIKKNELVLEIAKTWIAKFQNTRDPHIIAHGQVREVTELFDVMGEKLMFPQDTSHGASLVNVINCNCKDIYT